MPIPLHRLAGVAAAALCLASAGTAQAQGKGHGKEHKTAEFLALNPRGKVPVIRDGAFTLSESVAILLYLDRRFPEPVRAP